MTTLETLKAARKHIEKPHKWTRGELARDSRGREVEPTLMSACRFCAAGALIRAAGTDWGYLYDNCRTRLRVVMGVDSISVFNDHHTHAEVLAAFDEAIAKLEVAK